MKVFRLFFLSFVVTFLLISCDSNQQNNKKGILFSSGGKTSELLIVANENIQKSMTGREIKDSLQVINPWLTQAEPEFDVTSIPHKAFGDIYKKFRNILWMKIDSNLSNASIKIRKNVFAKPQIVVEIKAPGLNDLRTAFMNNLDFIRTQYHQAELDRIKAAYLGLRIDSLEKKLVQKFDFKMTFPQGFFMATDAADFAWVRKVTADIEEGFLIYTQPYTGDQDFSLQQIIRKRNEITKKYIPGPVDGSYMKVSTVFPPYHVVSSFKGNYASLTRSWWDVEKYPMGGPFIHYNFVDTVANRLICLDGYIRAPKKDKRDLLLHLEAILDSFEMK